MNIDSIVDLVGEDGPADVETSGFRIWSASQRIPMSAFSMEAEAVRWCCELTEGNGRRRSSNRRWMWVMKMVRLDWMEQRDNGPGNKAFQESLEKPPVPVVMSSTSVNISVVAMDGK